MVSMSDDLSLSFSIKKYLCQINKATGIYCLLVG